MSRGAKCSTCGNFFPWRPEYNYLQNIHLFQLSSIEFSWSHVLAYDAEVRNFEQGYIIEHSCDLISTLSLKTKESKFIVILTSLLVIRQKPFFRLISSLGYLAKILAYLFISLKFLEIALIQWCTQGWNGEVRTPTFSKYNSRDLSRNAGKFFKKDISLLLR